MRNGKILRISFSPAAFASILCQVRSILIGIGTLNGANSFILYGKGGEIATNDLENQELIMLALHLLQICLVYINTLMIYAHVTPYGTFRLDMSQRLAIEEDTVAA